MDGTAAALDRDDVLIDGPSEASFVDSTEPDERTAITAASADEPARIDASDARIFYPIARGVRHFDSSEDVMEALLETFGGTVAYDADGQMSVGGSYTIVGGPVFQDRELDAQFRIGDPILAYLGGAQGRLEIGDRTLCVDPDGDCEGYTASYLEPGGSLTAHPPVIDLCGNNGVCVRYTSFYNLTWIPFPFPLPYARHGTNVTMTTYSALPNTVLEARGFLLTEGVNRNYFSTVTNTGQNSIETSRWNLGDLNSAEWRTTDVCGTGRIIDVDINATRLTANGPAVSGGQVGGNCP